MQVTKFNLVTDLQIMLSNVTHSNFYFECNKERGPIDQLYIELGFSPYNPENMVRTSPHVVVRSGGPVLYDIALYNGYFLMLNMELEG